MGDSVVREKKEDFSLGSLSLEFVVGVSRTTSRFLFARHTHKPAINIHPSRVSVCVPASVNVCVCVSVCVWLTPTFDIENTF